LGQETFNKVNAYKIKLSKPDIEYTYYIDPSTYYILKVDSKTSSDGSDGNNSKSYSNYKKTDFGYVVPFTIMTNNMGYDVIINYTKVENK
jgi:hypothetical protein